MNDEALSKDKSQKIEVVPSSSYKPPRVGTFRMIGRMLLGGAVIGREELKTRFQESQSDTHVPAAELNKVTPVESDADRMRYATIGAMAKSSNAIRGGASLLGRISNRAYQRITRSISPITNSRPMSPVRRQYQRFIDRGDMIVSDWIATGRREEYLSRQLTQDVAVESIEGTLDYLADSPEMDELVQAQSGDLIEDIFDDATGGISKTSLIFVDWINAAILRKPRSQPDSSTDTPDE